MRHIQRSETAEYAMRPFLLSVSTTGRMSEARRWTTSHKMPGISQTNLNCGGVDRNSTCVLRLEGVKHVRAQ